MSRVIPVVHAERLNHVKEALDISEQQLAQWVRFRGAVNAAMRLLPESLAEDQRGTRANYPTLPVALDIQLRQSLLRLEVCRTMRAHVADLYSVLSDKQRVLADRLLAPILVNVMESEHRAPAPLAA
jgi:UDP-N-acetylglucosamine enolpyruvyl transferase